MNNHIFGVNAVYEAVRLRSQDMVRIILSKSRTSHHLSKILELARQSHIPVVQQEEREFRRWIQKMGFHNPDQISHQGIIAELRHRENRMSLEDILSQIQASQRPGFLLICDEITDPHNLGALIRSAACAGVNAVIIPRRGAAQVTPVVVKVSAGGTEHVPVCRVGNIHHTLLKLKEEGYQTIGLAGDAPTSLFKTDLTGSVAIVIGGESQGLRRMVRETCDVLAKIPMRGQLDSLNASVAGGIALFEALRQRTS